MKKTMATLLFIGMLGIIRIQPVQGATSLALENVPGRILAMILSHQEAKDICSKDGKSPWNLQIEDGKAAQVPTYSKFVSAFGEVVCNKDKSGNAGKNSANTGASTPVKSNVNTAAYKASLFHKNALAVLQNERPEKVLLEEFRKMPAAYQTSMCKGAEKFDQDLGAALNCGSSSSGSEDKKKESKPKEEKPKTPEELKKLEEAKEKAKRDILEKIKAK